MSTKHSAQRSLWAWAVFLLLLSGCSQPPQRPAPLASPDPQLQVLRMQLDTLTHRQEGAEAEQQRAHDTLTQQLAESTAREAADRSSLAVLQREVERVHAEGAGRYQRDQEVLRELRERLGELQRDQASYTASLDLLRQSGASFASQVDAIGATLKQYLRDIATALNHKDSLFEKALPALLGTLIGGLLAAGTALYFASRSEAHTNAQKRVEATIKLTETYLSETFQKKYSRALGLLEKPIPALSAPAAQNEVLEIIGFFKFVQELDKRHLLDTKLLDDCRISKEGDYFFANVKQVALAHSLDSLASQLPPERT